MRGGANSVHIQLRSELENYILSQYFGKSQILLDAVRNRIDEEGLLYQQPYIESSPAYVSELNGIQKSSIFPEWLKEFFPACQIRSLAFILHRSSIRLTRLYRIRSAGYGVCLETVITCSQKYSGK